MTKIKSIICPQCTDTIPLPDVPVEMIQCTCGMVISFLREEKRLAD